MHDGQNLFDPATSYAGILWAVDKAILKLAANDVILLPIVVGIWNTEKRFEEYLPEKPFDGDYEVVFLEFAEKIDGKPLSDNYLKFLVTELNMTEAGYAQGKDWMTRRFEDAEHSEKSWQKRVDIPLAFLLGGE